MRNVNLSLYAAEVIPTNILARPIASPIIYPPAAQDQNVYCTRMLLRNDGKTVSGVTKNSLGVALGSCTVELYHTATKQKIAATMSDPVTGAYQFTGLQMGENYYVRAYKAGSPDVAGTTREDMVAI